MNDPNYQRPSCGTCAHFREQAFEKGAGRCNIELPPYLQDMLTVKAARRAVYAFSHCSFHKEAV